MHGGSGSDDEGPKVEEEEEKAERWARVPSGRETKRESGSGGLSFGSWAHRPLESEIASDRN